MEYTTDNYAKGMAQWEESFDNTTIEWDRFQFNQFKDYLKGNMLEIGAGFGRISRLATRHSNFDSLTLTEPSTIFFNRLKKNFENEPKVSVTDKVIEDMTLTCKDFYDVVYSVHVLEHIEDDKEFINTSLKLLKKSGYMIISVPALNFLYSDLDKEIGHYRRYNKRMVRNLISGLNVDLIDMHYSDFLGVLGSFLVSKIGKKKYQGSKENKNTFINLAGIYSKYFIPINMLIEKIVTPPVGLNLTFVLKKI